MPEYLPGDLLTRTRATNTREPVEVYRSSGSRAGGMVPEESAARAREEAGLCPAEIIAVDEERR
jgi:hypothetical protein